MIPAATRTLASFITASGNGSTISEECISFEHPQIQPLFKPNLNLYCYYLQPSRWVFHEAVKPVKLRNIVGQTFNSSDFSVDWLSNQPCQWFDLTFLVSATDHTVLGEQQLLSEVLTLLANHPFLPERCLAPALRGKGQLPIQVSTMAAMDPLMLWQVLRTPLHLALHVTLTIPFSPSVGFLTKPWVNQATY